MTTLVKLFLIIQILTVATVSLAREKGVLSLGDGRMIAYETEIFRKKGPVLVFMPGIYRGLRNSDEITPELVSRKISHVYFHFAEQPDSVVKGSENKAPDFSNVTPMDLAHQVKALVDHLEIQNPIPVSISYSAIVVPYLDVERFPLVIESVPIGQDTDGLPEGVASLYRAWRDYIRAFPYGDFWYKTSKVIQLRTHWYQRVVDESARLPRLQQSVYHERALQGYVALTMASEDFDLRVQPFSKGPRRYYIVAGEEDETLKGIQNEAINKYMKQTGEKEFVYEVPEAGHIVMADQPGLYADVLTQILARENAH